MKDEFLATLSHEIRTPLSAMLGWSVMLQRTPSNEQKLLHGLSVIERNARAQERLITDLLDVSRIITGKLRFTMQRFRIEDPVHSAVEVVQDAATAKGVHLRVDVDLETGAMVGDAQRIQQVVWNLLVNAVRHTPADGVVTLTLQREGSAIVIRVKDTGEGIAPEHLPHVFERFHQVDSSSTRRHGGLGLGLAIVRHIVEAHGGTVEGTSEGQGCGSTFTVCLPVRAVDLEAPDRPSADYRKADEPAKAPQGEMPLLDVRVLVVDDDADSRDLIQALLEGVGATATTVGNASAALDAIERMRSFDVIVSDIGMPGEDGYTLIQRVRSAGLAQSVPAIALTAYARDEDARRALRSGFQAHLSKPVDPQKLVDAIGRLAPARHAPHGTEGAP
jgi:CheY-like chemotaxis protein